MKPLLTESEADAVYERVRAGESIPRLAQELGFVSSSGLYRLLSRRYGHQPNPRWLYQQTLFLPKDPGLVGYVAGIYDGEGSLSYRVDKLWIARVSMTEEPLIRWLGSFGGSVRTKAIRVEEGKPRKQQWEWLVARQLDVYMMMTTLLPYLWVKREKATAAIEDIRPRVEHSGSVFTKTRDTRKAR